MDSNKKSMLDEVSAVVQHLNQKIESLQEKVNELCKSTGNCSYIKKAHKDLLSNKTEK